MSFKVAIVGATGRVGQEIRNILQERNFPIKDLIVLASPKSAGKKISFGESTIKVQAIEEHLFNDVDICLMSAGSDVSKEWAPKISSKGVVVVDNSSCWRFHNNIPLIVPEVNLHKLDLAFEQDNPHKFIIGNPNCSTIQTVVALKPLHDLAVIKRIVASTYQSVSGAGISALNELWSQTKGIYENRRDAPNIFPTQIAFNVIPQIGDFMDSGSTMEEWKIEVEIKKILDKKIKTTSTAVRVPVFVGHAVAANVEFTQQISAAEAREALEKAEGITLVDNREPGGYATPNWCKGTDETYVSRLREDSTVENGLNLWIVADNLRKGAALNTVQIAEHIIERLKQK